MLYIVATPIGNLGDMSLRAIDGLREADAIACEDTRRTWTLLSHFDIPRPGTMISYREGNERHAGERVLALLEAGKTVALCSDGGYPGISDPGYRLIQSAVEVGHALEVLPGASAITVALLTSGLSTSSFTFKGFPPRKSGAMTRFFEEEADRPHTIIFYESPMRVHKSLCSAYGALGDRLAAVCIELTKKHERTSRGYLSELCAEYEEKTIKGEVTIVIAGNNPKFTRNDES